MKVSLFSTFEKNGGAAVASNRLFTGLNLFANLEYLDYCVLQKESKRAGVYAFGNSNNARRYNVLNKFPLLLYPNREANVFSQNNGFIQLQKYLKKNDPDLIHLHWVNNGYIGLKDLLKVKQPILWTLHDMWNFTGGCHYAINCEKYVSHCARCPYLKSSFTYDLSYLNFSSKLKLYKNLQNITFITPSHWLAQLAKESELLKDFRIEVIPNGIDTNVYRPIPKETAKSLLNIPESKKVILLGSVNAIRDRRKGFYHIRNLIQQTSTKDYFNDVIYLIFGANDPNDSELNKFENIRFLGIISDEYFMSIIYSAADVFILPSELDNLPNTVLESLACGTPVASFDVGGIKDMIDHELNGYLVEPFSINDFMHGIEKILFSENYQDLSLNAVNKIRNQFDLKLVVKKHIDLYKSVV